MDLNVFYNAHDHHVSEALPVTMTTVGVDRNIFIALMLGDGEVDLEPLFRYTCWSTFWSFRQYKNPPTGVAAWRLTTVAGIIGIQSLSNIVALGVGWKIKGWNVCSIRFQGTPLPN